MTLRTKILAGYGIALLLMAAMLGWAFASLMALGSASEAILRENYRSILAAQNMVGNIERQDSAVLMMMLGQADEGLTQFSANETQFLQWLARAKDNVTIPGEEQIVEGIATAYSAYLKDFETLCVAAGGRPQAQFYHDTMLADLLKVREGCEQLRDINQKTMTAASERAHEVGRRALWSTGAIGAAALVVGLGFSLLLTHLLVRPLREMMAATERIAQGEYDVQVAAQTSDELGRLAGGFNAMVRKLAAYRDLNVGQIVAEKRKSEAIIRSIDDGVVVVDAELKVTSMNPTAAQALGVDAHEAVGRHFLEVARSEQLFEHVKSAVESGSPPAIEEGKSVLSVERAGERRHYQFSITPVRSGGEQMLGVVLLLRDVTRLTELDRLKSEFVMAASHELRTPVTAMQMSVELLRESARRKLDPKEQELLDACHNELGRLRALLDDLLDLSRIEAGKMEMEIEEVPARMLLEKAVSVFRTQAEEAGVALSAQLGKGVGAVRADPNKITWVLTNLVANALHYTGRGGHVALKAEAAGGWVHVSVSDDGEGIPYEYQSRIFDKFVQAKGARGGTGLGLAICKEIVRAHGGTIWVDSEPGHGSTFTFTLPGGAQ